MNPLRTSRDPLKTSQDRPRRPHAPSEDLQRPSQDLSRPSQKTPWTMFVCLRAPQYSTRSPKRWASAKLRPQFCAMLGRGKRANFIVGVAKIREFRALGPHEPTQDLRKTSQDRPRRPHAPSQDLQRPSQDLSGSSQETSWTLFVCLRGPLQDTRSPK